MNYASVTALILPLLIAAPMAEAGGKGPKFDKLPFFEGGGNGFGGFASGDKPGKGIPGGIITPNRSPTAVAVLSSIFSAVSSTSTTATD